MARQARAEATRHKIIDAAVDIFSEVGYASTGLGEIIERAASARGQAGVMILYIVLDEHESLRKQLGIKKAML